LIAGHLSHVDGLVEMILDPIFAIPAMMISLWDGWIGPVGGRALLG
jgi:hypothetical protein